MRGCSTDRTCPAPGLRLWRLSAVLRDGADDSAHAQHSLMHHHTPTHARVACASMRRATCASALPCRMLPAHRFARCGAGEHEQQWQRHLMLPAVHLPLARSAHMQSLLAGIACSLRHAQVPGARRAQVGGEEVSRSSRRRSKALKPLKPCASSTPSRPSCKPPPPPAAAAHCACAFAGEYSNACVGMRW